MSDPHWRVEFTPRARKDLLHLDRQVQRRIVDALDRLAAGERLSGDVRRLVGSTEYRLRVGDWRIRFELDGDRLLITVVRILPRGRAYDR
ncbi:MAG TPA: type II toxin-antitoxin system RelE/ParE family toxin [Solirubrobacteraceae bacterium]|nr:type II toxin-antitoxin system RelE/ParE family toxin [Solirubrobacteraceae bacterium]